MRKEAQRIHLPSGLPSGSYYVTWKPVYDKDRDKWVKYPQQRLNNPSSWYALKDITSKGPNVGVVLQPTHRLIAIDIDDVSLEHPAINTLITQYPTYIEYSPSAVSAASLDETPPDRYRIFYLLPRTSDKQQLRTKPVVERTSTGEIQCFISTGYVTITCARHPLVLKDPANLTSIATIPTSVLLDLWPKMRIETPSTTGLPTAALASPLASLTAQEMLLPLSRWVKTVKLNKSHNLVQALMERYSWDHYQYWLTGLMSIKVAAEQCGLSTHEAMALADTWSQSDRESYSDKDFLSTWTSLSVEGGITIATYNMFARHFSPSWPLVNPRTKQPVLTEHRNWLEFMKRDGFDVRVDKISRAPYLIPLDEASEAAIFPGIYRDKAHQLTCEAEDMSRVTARLLSHCYRFGYHLTIKQLREHMATTLEALDPEVDYESRFVNEVDKIREQMRREGDTRDYISEWISLVHRSTDHDHPTQEFHELLLRKWLWSVARSFWPEELAPQHRGQAAEGMLILSAVQGGIGKSTLPSLLFPEEWRKQLVINEVPQTGRQFEDKDFKSKTCTRLVVCYDEVEQALKPSILSAFKSEMSATTDTFRPAWGKQMLKLPRLYSIVATTNKDTLLLPMEGGRRWWWLNIESIDIPAMFKFPTMKMWAQCHDELIKASQADPHGKPPWYLTDEQSEYMMSYREPQHKALGSDALILQDMFVTDKDKIVEYVERCKVDPDLTIMDVTSNLTAIARELGEKPTSALRNALKELLYQIMPREISFGRTRIIHGLYQYGRSPRYFMPPRATEFR